MPIINYIYICSCSNETSTLIVVSILQTASNSSLSHRLPLTLVQPRPYLIGSLDRTLTLFNIGGSHYSFPTKVGTFHSSFITKLLGVGGFQDFWKRVLAFHSYFPLFFINGRIEGLFLKPLGLVGIKALLPSYRFHSSCIYQVLRGKRQGGISS